MAEQSELTDRLGRWVLRTALVQLAEWDGRLGPDAPRGLSVNLSPRQCHDPRLPRQVLAALEDAGVAPGRLWLEVTESTITPDDPAVTRTLQQISDAGVHVAIDDQLRLLRVVGCDLAQGYRFGRPMWRDELVRHLLQDAS